MPSATGHAYRSADYLLGFFILSLGGFLLFCTARYLQPFQLPSATPGSYHYIAQLDEIAPGTAVAFELEGRPWLLARTRSDISAVSGYCTFRGSRLHWDSDNKVFQCEGHGCIFGLHGHPISGLTTSPLKTLKIRIVGNRIYGARDLS